MKITAVQAKSITQDWQNHFPSLGIYKPLHLMRRCGPLLVGLCLNRSSSGDIYKPTFHYHCLLRQFPTVSLSLAVQLKAPNGTDAAISTKFHEKKLPEAAAKMRALALLPFDFDFGVVEFDVACDKWLGQQQTPYWPAVMEDRVLLHAWAGKDYTKALRDAEAALKSWPAFVTDKFGGVSSWVERVELAARNREALAGVLAAEIDAHRVASLPTGNLIT
ncbi:MAG: hypothetical protein H7A09_09995 [Oceanospirillaceae bacterium]|nr:hypothetical protein [Oceanospirillaceae bacterium]MCP5335129.1 hypothetical protein [Oceanospirillaceae bacterium]